MDDNYIDIQAHIYRARKLRNEAAGEIIAAGWHSIKTMCLGLLNKSKTALQPDYRRKLDSSGRLDCSSTHAN